MTDQALFATAFLGMCCAIGVGALVLAIAEQLNAPRRRHLRRK